MPMTAMYLPRLSLNEKQLPDIKSWQVGKSYKVTLEVELVALRKDEYGKSPLTGDFKISKVNDKNLMSQEQLMAQMGRR